MNQSPTAHPGFPKAVPATFQIFELLFYASLFVFPLFAGSVEPWSFSIGAVLFGGAFSLYWFTRGLRQPALYTDLDRPLAAYLVFFIISLSFSRVHYLSFVELFKLAVVLSAFWAVRYLCRQRLQRYRLSECFVFLGGLYSAFGLLQFVGGFPKNWWSHPHFLSSTYVNHNHFAGLLVLALPISLGLIVAERDRSKKVLFFFFTVLMAAALVLTLSRGAFISVFVSSIFFVWVLKKRRLIASGALPMILVAVVVLAAVLILGTSTLESRIASIRSMTEEEALSIRLRWLTWQGALSMILRFFWLGAGPGTFGHLFLQFRPQEASVMRSVYAHNDLLHLWAECGVFAFLAMTAVTVVLFRSGLRIIRYDDSRLRIGVGGGILAGLSGLLVHGLFDFNFHIPANWLLSAVAAGLLFSMDDEIRYSGMTGKRVKAVVSLTLLMIFPACFFLGISNYRLWEARNLLKEGQSADALVSAGKSIQWNPWDAEPYYLRGFIHSRDNAQEAVKDFNTAIRLNPYEPVYDMAKARALAPALAERSPSELIAMLKQAIDKDPNNQSLAIMAARETFGREGAGFTRLKHLAGNLLEQRRSTLAGLVTYLETRDRWQYHREYHLKLEGSDPDARKRGDPADLWNRPPDVAYTLADFSTDGGQEVIRGEAFFKNGRVTKKIDISNPLVRLVLNAKGSPVNGVYPSLYVRIDGKLADEYYVDSKNFKNFFTDLQLTPGPHVLGLEYVNDLKIAGEDRTVWIKRVELRSFGAGK